MATLRDGQLQFACVGDTMVRVFHPSPADGGSLRCIARAGASGAALTRSAPAQLRLVPGAEQGRLVSDSSALARLVVGRSAVVEGDLVLLATDGLLDNLEDDEVREIMETRTRGAARALAEGASRARRKPDDVTVLVGLVVK